MDSTAKLNIQDQPVPQSNDSKIFNNLIEKQDDGLFVSRHSKECLVIVVADSCTDVLDELLECSDLKLLPTFVWDSSNCIPELLGDRRLVRQTTELIECVKGFLEVNVVLGVTDSEIRRCQFSQVNELLRDVTLLRFPNLVHSTAHVSCAAVIGQGVFIAQYAVVHSKAKLESFCIINSGCIVENCCVVKEFVTVASGSVVRSTAQHSMPDNRIAVQGLKTAASKVKWCVHKTFSIERFENYIQDSIASGQTTNGGPLQKILSRKVRELCDSKRIPILTSNGTAALHALACAFELKAGRRLKWATQAFTFPSSIQVIMSCTFAFIHNLIESSSCR
jgi:hypothetical protein